MSNTVYPSSIVLENVKQIEPDQSSFPTWSILITLVIVLLIIKKFVYIKDPSRHGK